MTAWLAVRHATQPMFILSEARVGLIQARATVGRLWKQALRAKLSLVLLLVVLPLCCAAYFSHLSSAGKKSDAVRHPTNPWKLDKSVTTCAEGRSECIDVLIQPVFTGDFLEGLMLAEFKEIVTSLIHGIEGAEGLQVVFDVPSSDPYGEYCTSQACKEVTSVLSGKRGQIAGRRIKKLMNVLTVSVHYVEEFGTKTVSQLLCEPDLPVTAITLNGLAMGELVPACSSSPDMYGNTAAFCTIPDHTVPPQTLYLSHILMGLSTGLASHCTALYSPEFASRENKDISVDIDNLISLPQSDVGSFLSGIASIIGIASLFSCSQFFVLFSGILRMMNDKVNGVRQSLHSSGLMDVVSCLGNYQYVFIMSFASVLATFAVCRFTKASELFSVIEWGAVCYVGLVNAANMTTFTVVFQSLFKRKVSCMTAFFFVLLVQVIVSIVAMVYPPFVLSNKFLKHIRDMGLVSQFFCRLVFVLPLNWLFALFGGSGLLVILGKLGPVDIKFSYHTLTHTVPSLWTAAGLADMRHYLLKQNVVLLLLAYHFTQAPGHAHYASRRLLWSLQWLFDVVTRRAKRSWAPKEPSVPSNVIDDEARKHSATISACEDLASIDSEYAVVVRNQTVQFKVPDKVRRLASAANVNVSHLSANNLLSLGIRKGSCTVLLGQNGSGKCLARDTPVLMASGQFKMVQDIEKGERLMGDDNTPRNVLSTATGREEMARVTLSKGASFTCNVSHVLSLKLSHPIEKGHEATFLCRFHVIVRDSEGLVTEIRSCSKSFEAQDDRDRFFDALHESAVFEGKEVVRSGDVLDVTVRTLLDRECVAAAVYDRLLSFHSSAVDFVEPVVSEHSGDGVSDSVKYGSRRERLEFLASVVDADGVLVADNFEITLQDEELVADVSFIACSLGFLVTRKHGMLSVSGHIDTVPTRDPTKQASLSDQQSGHLCEAFTLELLPEDDYFGFTLDGNARFIVSEDFIVTHNTTMINSLIGRASRVHGAARVLGVDVDTHASLVQSMASVCPQFDVFWAELTCSEHICYYAALRGMGRKEAFKQSVQLLADVGLTKEANARAAHLSGGQRRRLCIACALVGDPKVVCLDEPSSGLDVSVQRTIWSLILRLRKNRTILVTTHSMLEAEALGDSVAVMNAGKLIALGSASDLRARFGSDLMVLFDMDLERRDAAAASVRDRVAAVTGRMPRAHAGSTPSRAVFKLPFAQEQRARTLDEAEELGNELPDGVTGFSVASATLDDVFISLTTRSEELEGAFPSMLKVGFGTSLLRNWKPLN